MMAKFFFLGRTLEGEPVRGNVMAADRDRVLSQLLGQGISPVEIREIEVKQSFALGGGWPKDNDRLLFVRQLHTLLDAGIPLNRAIISLRDGMDNVKFQEALDAIASDLEAGKEMATAFAAHPKVFPRIFVSIIAVGERSGRLSEALEQLYKYMEVDQETRKKIKTALRYPAMVVAAVAGAILIMLRYVIPEFKKLFDQFGADLPWQTQLLIDAGQFTVDHGLAILLGLIATPFAFRYFIKTPAGRKWWDNLKMKMPVVGKIIRRATLARFARTFAMCLRSGLPIDQTMKTVAASMDNVILEEGIKQIRERIERGESLHRSAKASGLFTHLVLQMMAVGEETGRGDAMLESVAKFYEGEVDYAVKNLASAIEPILLVIMGGLVLILAAGIFMPMWTMGLVAMQ